ncbi:glycosyltransferase family 92 protein At1g27200-like [Chenopodium quinoa]|uniref:glycosyltransferase family 92 protein At1g27200-like n=1 Tax=Chenopodium quinoa TaxID=63459 RepID=UPI000B773495|nr:glycosyltransferase family 92 protein At1g27200-like [Chenopodium quinoa]
MVRKSRKNIFLIILAVITFFAVLSHHIYRFANQSLSLSSTCIFRRQSLDFLSPPPSPPPPPSKPLLPLQPPPSPPSKVLSTEAILIPDWEVLVILPPETPLLPPLENNYLCIYPDKSSTPAKFAGKLPFNGGFSFKCNFPASNRRRLPFFQPALVRTEEREILAGVLPPPKLLLRWNFIVYDSFTTENDVVLLVKGVNNRQGSSRPPSNFRCVFGHDSLTPVKTNVTSSSQEVFRCNRPGITGSRPISVTIEIVEDDRTAVIIPSLAKYVPDNQRTIMQFERKSLICACTMVNNVGKFLREWVMFHAKIGVEKFILYDNDSEDDLGAQVEGLRNEGFDVRTVYWVWPKAQEAGFSHCALYSARICDWAAFVDIDEFFLSPSWLESPRPRANMLRELLPERPEVDRVGQVSIRCNEFGPSNQTTHPIDGVTQGYTCRSRADQRHKSIVYLPALDHSLLNVVHHFQVKDGYKSLQIGTNRAIVNHYKYQAWPEFQAKFRRRVSAYVIDWRVTINPSSNDRAPGLGFEPIEPPGWAQKFCEVIDDRMKVLTMRWFGNSESTMAWQSS